jgi:hypothetical protein
MQFYLQLNDLEDMTKCKNSSNAVNTTTGCVDVRIEPFGCWSKRPNKEYEQSLSFPSDKYRKFILDWNCKSLTWQDPDTSITVYFNDGERKEEVFNNPYISCPILIAIIIGKGLLIAIIILCIIAAGWWCYSHNFADRIARAGNMARIIRAESITACTSSAPNHQQLVELLSDIDSQWNHIGIALGVKLNVIEGIRQQHYDNKSRLTSVLQQWINKNVDVTWDKLIEAIEGRIVNNEAKANEIRQSLSRQRV